MLRSILRWFVPLAALLVLGPLAGVLTTALRAPDGGPDTSLLLCAWPLQGILAGLGAFALAAVAGCIASRLHGSQAGLFAAGLVLAWAAWGTGRIDQIIRRTGSASTFWMLALEGLLVGVLAVFICVLILGAATIRKRRPSRVPRPAGSPVTEHVIEGFFIAGAPGAATGGVVGLIGAMIIASGLQRPQAADDSDGPTSLFSPGSLLALLFALVAGAAGAWLIAREPLKGQTFAAAAVAGVLAAAIGHISAPRAPATLFVLVAAILAAVGPAAAMVINFVPTNSGDSAFALLPAGTQIVASVRAGMLLPLARPLPLDWISGAFVGIPMGLSWAAAMVEKHVPEPA